MNNAMQTLSNIQSRKKCSSPSNGTERVESGYTIFCMCMILIIILQTAKAIQIIINVLTFRLSSQVIARVNDSSFHQSEKMPLSIVIHHLVAMVVEQSNILNTENRPNPVCVSARVISFVCYAIFPFVIICNHYFALWIKAQFNFSIVIRLCPEPSLIYFHLLSVWQTVNGIGQTVGL